MTIQLSCGCVATDDDGEDGMGHLVSWKSEDCDAMTGFHNSVSYGSLCNKCLAKYQEWGIVLETEADENAWLGFCCK